VEPRGIHAFKTSTGRLFINGRALVNNAHKYIHRFFIFESMETIIKVKDSAEGRRLIAHLQSLSYVKVLGDSTNLVDLRELKGKIKKAESSRSLTLDEAMRRSAAWKSKYK
jgi:hypothetical protein